MTSERTDGGPAFPQHVAPAYRQEPEIWGMSLLDWHAGQALPAVIIATSAGQHMPTMRAGDDHIRDAIARDAYAMGRAMLAARKGFVFTDAELFNCWSGGKGPTREEVARFDWLEVGGCRDVHSEEGWTEEERARFGTCVEGCDDADAQFWSVYGHYRPTDTHAGCECITDGPAGDKARAWAIAEHLGQLWGLPVKAR